MNKQVHIAFHKFIEKNMSMDNDLEDVYSAGYKDGFSAKEQEVASQKPIQISANDIVLNILGRPNFACGGIAKILRKLGHSIPTKAEHEQAHVLLWMLNLYLKYGEKWAEIGEEYLTRPLPAPQGNFKIESRTG